MFLSTPLTQNHRNTWSFSFWLYRMNSTFCLSKHVYISNKIYNGYYERNTNYYKVYVLFSIWYCCQLCISIIVNVEYTVSLLNVILCHALFSFQFDKISLSTSNFKWQQRHIDVVLRNKIVLKLTYTSLIQHTWRLPDPKNDNQKIVGTLNNSVFKY